jgi:hypothetical protein
LGEARVGKTTRGDETQTENSGTTEGTSRENAAVLGGKAESGSEGHSRAQSGSGKEENEGSVVASID